MDLLRTDLPHGTTLEQWDEAYLRVEAIFSAYRIRNKLLLSNLVRRVLVRANMRLKQDAGLDPAVVAVQEVEKEILEWFALVLDFTGSDKETLSQQGRLALLLAEMPEQWQDQFLQPPPWPEAFVDALQQAYLLSNPNFQRERMIVRPLALGAISEAAESALLSLDRMPRLKMLLLWGVGIAGFCILFWVTR